jgi:hypothetical protein
MSWTVPKKLRGCPRGIEDDVPVTVDEAHLAGWPDHAKLQVERRPVAERSRKRLVPDRPILGKYSLIDCVNSHDVLARGQAKYAVGLIGPGDAIFP